MSSLRSAVAALPRRNGRQFASIVIPYWVVTEAISYRCACICELSASGSGRRRGDGFRSLLSQRYARRNNTAGLNRGKPRLLALLGRENFVTSIAVIPAPCSLRRLGPRLGLQEEQCNAIAGCVCHKLCYLHYRVSAFQCGKQSEPMLTPVTLCSDGPFLPMAALRHKAQARSGDGSSGMAQWSSAARLSRSGDPYRLLLALNGLGGLARAQAVIDDEEVHEEPKEGLHVDEVHDRDLVRHAGARARDHKVALRVHQQELDHLDRGQVRLPPDLTRVRAHEVVHVHDRVHAAVEHDGHVEVAIVGLRLVWTAPTGRVEQKKTYEEHGDVVVHVEHRELLPLLAHDDEEGVAEVEHLGQVEDVHEVAHDGVLVVSWWVPPVTGQGGRSLLRVTYVAAGLQDGLDSHVRAEHDLDGVVDELERGRVERGHARLHDELVAVKRGTIVSIPSMRMGLLLAACSGAQREEESYRAHHHEGEVADAEREDRGEVGQEVVLHGRLAVAQGGVHPVHEDDVHAVGPLLVALEECAGHRAAAASAAGVLAGVECELPSTKEEVTRGGQGCRGPA
ncbi:hypothetical protein ON010_g251 [Phytophthora cinnamomi]|nr:hypothetical protein ON010_g251 [Phytophthora cinnamomi]